MKLKYFFLTLSVACLGLLNGCSDALNVAPDGNMTLEDVLKDPNKVEALLNSCYKQIPLKGLTYFFWEPLLVTCSDDAWSTEDFNSVTPVAMYYADLSSATMHPISNYDEGPFTPAGQDGGVHNSFNDRPWKRFWPQIRLCTQFIENIDRAAVSSETNRARMKAEAYVLRAYFYSELVKNFGKVPILRESIAFDADYSELTRNSVYDVAKFIGEDCDMAINTAELPWRITINADALRVTKALAWAIKTKMMLFAASPLHNVNNNASYWEEAYQTGKQAVAALRSNGYELYTQCTNEALYGTYGSTGGALAYHQLFCETADYSATPRDKETIWQHNRGKTPGEPSLIPVSHVSSIGSNMRDTNKPGPCPTQELVDAYETADGQPVLNLSQPYLDENHLQPNYNPANTLYNRNDPYANRDPRMNVTLLHNGSNFSWEDIDFTVEAYEGGRHHVNETGDASKGFSRTSYFHNKMVPPRVWGANQPYGATFKFYRFGEVLLDYAEAAAEANHLDEAKAATDEIRARVNMPPLPSGLSQTELILRIRNERRVELAFEEQRFYDLRRWQKPNGDLSATCKWFTGMRITKNSDDTYSYQRFNVWPTPRGGWQNRDLLMPIPLNEVSIFGALTGENWQNPGW